MHYCTPFRMRSMRLLQCVATCCSVLQCVAVHIHTHIYMYVRHCAPFRMCYMCLLQCVTTCCSVLQCISCYPPGIISAKPTATRCNTLQHNCNRSSPENRIHTHSNIFTHKNPHIKRCKER